MPMQYTVWTWRRSVEAGEKKQSAWCDWSTVRAAAKEREASGKRKCHGIIFHIFKRDR